MRYLLHRRRESRSPMMVLAGIRGPGWRHRGCERRPLPFGKLPLRIVLQRVQLLHTESPLIIHRFRKAITSISTFEFAIQDEFPSNLKHYSATANDQADSFQHLTPENINVSKPPFLPRFSQQNADPSCISPSDSSQL